MKKILLMPVLSLVLLITPFVVFAAPQTFASLVDLIVSFVNIIVVILISLAILGFFWGVSKYMLSGGDGAKVEEGRKVMIYGIIALFVMVSLWGILQILSYTFLDTSVGFDEPLFPGE